MRKKAQNRGRSKRIALRSGLRLHILAALWEGLADAKDIPAAAGHPASAHAAGHGSEAHEEHQ